MPDLEVDYDTLMRANLTQVFGQRDPARRLAAIRELYADDAILYEFEQAARGHEAISRAVGDLLDHLPPDFAFIAIRPAIGHHGVGRLPWRLAPPAARPPSPGPTSPMLKVDASGRCTSSLISREPDPSCPWRSPCPRRITPDFASPATPAWLR